MEALLNKDLMYGMRLSPREMDVVRRLVNGWTAKRVGEALGLSTRTVEVNTRRARAKLGAGNVHDLVRLALGSGLVEVSKVDPYEVLGLGREATREDVAAAYKRAAKAAHPDAGGSDEKFHQVATAGAVLRDPERRAKYDETGDLGGQPDNEHSAAVGHVIEALDHIVGQWVGARGAVGDPTGGPMLERMRARIQSRLDDVRSTVATLTRGIDALVRVEKRLRHKKEGGGPVLAAARAHRRTIESQRSDLEARVKSHEAALAMLADYDYAQEQTSATARSAEFLDRLILEKAMTQMSKGVYP